MQLSQISLEANNNKKANNATYDFNNIFESININYQMDSGLEIPRVNNLYSLISQLQEWISPALDSDISIRNIEGEEKNNTFEPWENQLNSLMEDELFLQIVNETEIKKDELVTWFTLLPENISQNLHKIISEDTPNLNRISPNKSSEFELDSIIYNITLLEKLITHIPIQKNSSQLKQLSLQNQNAHKPIQINGSPLLSLPNQNEVGVQLVNDLEQQGLNQESVQNLLLLGIETLNAKFQNPKASGIQKGTQETKVILSETAIQNLDELKIKIHNKEGLQNRLNRGIVRNQFPEGLQTLVVQNQNEEVQNLTEGTVLQLKQLPYQNVNQVETDPLFTFFQLLNNQLLNFLKSNDQAKFLHQKKYEPVVQKLENVLSSIYSSLNQPVHNNEESQLSKMNYLQSLFQRNVNEDKVKSTTFLQDSNVKIPFMGGETYSNIKGVQQFAIYMEQTPAKQPNQEKFIKDFQQILSKSILQQTGSSTRLLIKLYPEQLGQLRIELLQNEGVLTARMIASTPKAKELLESQIQGLKNSFISQNIQVEKIEISHSQLLNQQHERNFDKNQSQQDPNPNNKKNEYSSEEDELDSNFEFTYKELLQNYEA
jgi:flagellar hook-length control protein FliK